MGRIWYHKGPHGWKQRRLSMMQGKNRGLGEVSAFPMALEQGAQGVAFCPPQQQVIGGGFSSSLFHSHPRHYSSSWEAFSWRRHSRNNPPGREARAEARGQGRSALGRHDVELPRQAAGLFLRPPNPAARNLRCTLGEAGPRLMVTCSNRQLMASVLEREQGQGQERALSLLVWLCVVLSAAVQPQRTRGFSCNENVCPERDRGGASWDREVWTLSRLCSLQSVSAPFPIQMKETMQCHNTNLHQAIRCPQLCALLCYEPPWLNTSFTHSHKSELMESQPCTTVTRDNQTYCVIPSLRSCCSCNRDKDHHACPLRRKVHFWHSLTLVVTLRRCWGN